VLMWATALKNPEHTLPTVAYPLFVAVSHSNNPMGEWIIWALDTVPTVAPGFKFSDGQTLDKYAANTPQVGDWRDKGGTRTAYGLSLALNVQMRMQWHDRRLCCAPSSICIVSLYATFCPLERSRSVGQLLTCVCYCCCYCVSHLYRPLSVKTVCLLAWAPTAVTSPTRTATPSCQSCMPTPRRPCTASLATSRLCGQPPTTALLHGTAQCLPQHRWS